jgi:hypothetical protein
VGYLSFACGDAGTTRAECRAPLQPREASKLEEQLMCMCAAEGGWWKNLRRRWYRQGWKLMHKAPAQIQPRNSHNHMCTFLSMHKTTLRIGCLDHVVYNQHAQQEAGKLANTCYHLESSPYCHEIAAPRRSLANLVNQPEHLFGMACLECVEQRRHRLQLNFCMQSSPTALPAPATEPATAPAIVIGAGEAGLQLGRDLRGE